MDRQSDKNISGVYIEKVDLSHIDTFLFDLDGTLIDSSEDIYRAVLHTLNKLGLSALPKKEVIKHVGYGGKKLLQGVLNTDDEDLLREAVSIFRDYYFSHPVEYTKLYSGIEELLKKIKEKGKRTAIVTNKYEDISKQIVEKLGISDYIDLIIGGDTLSEKKPSPLPVIYASEKLGSKKAIIIGDSETDIKSGKEAGIETCLVLYGFGKKDIALSFNPDYVIKHARQITV